MEVNLEGFELPTPVVGLALQGSLNLPRNKSQDYFNRLVTSATYWSMGMIKSLLADPKYNFNAYVTMEVNQEGSELPTPVVGLALPGSLNLPGSKSPDYSKRVLTLATYRSIGMRKSLLTPNTILMPM